MNATAAQIPTREQDIVNGCLDLLRLHGVFAWRQNVGRLPVKDRSGERLVRFASVNGISDIIGVLPGGRFLAIECKRPGNRPTEDQQAFLDAVNRRGGLTVVIYDADDLEEIIARELRRSE